jgi:SET domain-containing protein
MTREELLADLSKDTFVALRASPVHGIGVFAIRDIPKGCRTMFSTGVGNWIRLSISEVEALPSHSRNLVETYCLFDETDYFVPDYGFKLMDLVLYLNHSSSPNIVSVDDGSFFEALTDIPEGTELFVNYEEIVEVEGYE